MQGFSGFTHGGATVRVPGQFFADLLPQIDTLVELKVTLYVFWRLQKQEGRFYIWEREMSGDELFLAGLAPRTDDRPAALREGLERAVARGTLLLAVDEKEGRLYVANTPKGRAAVKGIEQGEWHPGDPPDTLLDLNVERPTIYVLYEQNIGPLTPLIADRLRDMEETFPAEWVTDAVTIAVEQNARSIKYIERILDRWQEEGRGEKKDEERDPFLDSKYGDFFE